MSNFEHFYETIGKKILTLSLQHIELTMVSMLIAIIISIPLGIFIAKTKYKHLQSTILSILSMTQTIPSLALIAFVMVLFQLIGLPTIGAVPGVTALVVYALLPIVRNTYTGISQVEASDIEVAKSMGMTKTQILFKVELPMSIPIIMTGIKISTTWTIGLVTLVALIGAGGLGDLIFSGIRNVRVNDILAGAIPAALMALIAEWLLGKFELMLTPIGLRDEKEVLSAKNSNAFWKKLIKISTVVGILVIIVGTIVFKMGSSNKFAIKSGFEAEFISRVDAFPGLYKKYDFKFNTPPRQMDEGLMYNACKIGSVDVICGYSTDGRIPAFNLVTLKDDKKFFPPYYAVPLVREQTLEKYPELQKILDLLAGKINETEMQRLNYSVSRGENPLTPQLAAKEFLMSKKLISADSKKGNGQAGTVTIGSKNYTEQSILGEMFALLIEYKTNLKVNRKLNLGGTMICFNALNSNDLDLYIDYTGTILLSILKQLGEKNPQTTYQKSKKLLKNKFNIKLLKPLGFNNTYTLTTSKDFSEKHKLETISDLVKLIKTKK